jgi:tRNA(Ile)-lysidine synthase
LIDRVAATIVRHAMFEPGQKVGLAVSGGADSVCLFHILRELAARWDLRLHVLHVNHGLRGNESDQDAAFVENLAGEFGLPCTQRRAVLPQTGNLEQAGREARLDFFSAAISSGLVQRVAVGHTRSDQAETVLFRFLRGAGSAGLAGIRPVTATGIVRPLLEIHRGQVEEFLKSRGLAWREDSTNHSEEFARNRIRHCLLPSLAEEWNPEIANTLAQTADWALAEESYWAAEIDRLEQLHLVGKGGGVLLQTGSLEKLPLAAARRLVRRAIERVRGDLRAVDFGHVSGVLELAGSVEGHGRLQVPGVDIMRSFDWLRFSKLASEPEARNYRLPAPVPGRIPVPGSDREIRLELIEKIEGFPAGDCVYNSEMVYVDWDRLSGTLDLRNWRPGDQYQPAGSTSEQRIKTLFQEHRIPLWERRHWPVLTDSDSIVWARQFGAASRVAATPESRTLLKIQESGIDREHGYVYRSEGR